MTALMHASIDVNRIRCRTVPNPMVGIIYGWSRARRILFPLAMVLTFQVRAAQQQSSKTPAPFPHVEEMMQQGHLDEAKAAMLDELQQNPSSIDGYNLLGIIESDRQNYANAIEAFQKALQLAPKSTKTHVNLGNVYADEKKLDLAEKEFRTVLRLDPANRDANYNLGVLLMAKNSPAQAIVHFRYVQPANLATSIHLIGAYFQCKRTAQALQLATLTSAQYKSNVQAHFTLAGLLASEKQYKAAQLELEKANALQPGTFEILYNLGLTYLLNANNSKAELALARALTLKPGSPDTLYLLAKTYKNESHPLDALDLLLRAHKIAPENTDIILLMAQISMSQNYYEDAIPLLESGLQIAPLRSDLRAALGESYFMAGSVDKAIEEFKKLLEIQNSGSSYAYLGLSYRNLGRFDEAKQYFQRGLEMDPHNISCIFNLGFIAERQGESAKAETMFQNALRFNPDYPDAILELANLRIAAGKYSEAEGLLRKYVRVSRKPATGYYKLAKVERSLHETVAAERDMSVFQTLSKDASAGPYPFEHLFDYLDNRSRLAPEARQQLDLKELSDQVDKHPDQPEDLYMLSEAYLRIGKIDEARSTIAQLDKISAGDYRTLTGIGVLLARYHYYDDAIRRFQGALIANPGSDEVIFDLANAYFRKRSYSLALEAASKVSMDGRKDEAYLALLGDIYAHLGDVAHASEIFRNAIDRNPDDDHNYLALGLLELRENQVEDAKKTFLKGQSRIPASGKLFWGLGLSSVLEGKTAEAAGQFERAVDLLPEWPGSYSVLGVFYFQTGQIAKAKEVLGRFKNSSVSGSLDVNRIEQFLAQAPETNSTFKEPMSKESRMQLLQLALSLADKTL